MTPLTILIPYVHKKAASDELLITLRSIEENFKVPHVIRIIGDLPDWASDQLRADHIATPLIAGMHYAHCLDVNNKMRTYLANPASADQFIYTYDDIVFLNPVKKSDITRLKADSFIESKEFILANSTGSRKWNNLLITTFRFLKSKGLPTFNYETHLPRLFKCADLQTVFDFPDFSIDPFLFSTVYFNMFFKSKPVILGSDRCNIKATIYEDNLSQVAIADLCQDKLFLNFNSKGYSRQMQRFLHKRFPNKCIHEL
jgi:hypothetical protein